MPLLTVPWGQGKWSPTPAAGSQANDHGRKKRSRFWQHRKLKGSGPPPQQQLYRQMTMIEETLSKTIMNFPVGWIGACSFCFGLVASKTDVVAKLRTPSPIPLTPRFNKKQKTCIVCMDIDMCVYMHPSR